jgi:hypothetical protein
MTILAENRLVMLVADVPCMRHAKDVNSRKVSRLKKCAK